MSQKQKQAHSSTHTRHLTPEEAELQRRKEKRRKQRKRLRRRKIWTAIFLIGIVLEMIVASVGLYTIYGMAKDKPDLSVDDFFSSESSHIYDKDGNQIADVGTTLRENVTYDEIPECVIDAFLSVEDSRFFEHDGFDLPRFTKSVFDTVKNKILGNSGVFGGSTFTMQLVKMTYFQNEETGETYNTTIEYKVQQIALAKELEPLSNKKSIFEMYLNRMNFGGTGNIRGIQKAAQYYYGKDVSELTLAEAAMLAGVINAPTYYDPHNYLDYATSRRNTVLDLMKRHGYITAEECKLAKAVKVEDTLIDPDTDQTGSYDYQAYIDTVIKEATELTGQDPLSVAMDIYTCMDPEVQSVVDGIQRGDYEEVAYPDDLMEIGIVAENNQTGEIVAIGGGRNYGRGGSMLLNHATDQYKQPGSSVKPFLDYALAFEYLGWATDHVVTDKPITYAGTDVIIKNANGQYHGQVTLSYAIAASLNTPAIQALQEVIDTVGYDTVTSYLTSLGFSQVSAENFDLGFAIGGSNFTCSVVELAAAHAIIMNGGNYITPHTITKIVYRSGTNEPVEPQYTGTSVLSEQAAWLTAQLMHETIYGGVYNYLQILERSYPTFGKTGTSDWGDEGLQYNIPQGSSKDKWMVCETTQYTIATWVGYEKGEKDQGTYFDTAKSNLNIPGNICSLVLDACTGDDIPSDLTMPEGISQITHIKGTFPYASPIEGMSEEWISTGYVKSEYAQLVDAEASEDIEELTSFIAGITDSGTLSYTFTPYPDSSKLSISEDNTMDISLYDADGNMLYEAYGTKLFDYSWIYGPIRYKIRLTQNGEVKQELVLETDTGEAEVTLNPDTDTEACGYYGYENGTTASNEICVSFHTSAVAEATATPSATASSQATASSESTEDNNSTETN